MESRKEVTLINKISREKASVLLETGRTTMNNLRYWYRKYPDVKRIFLSQEDRTSMDKDLPDGNFMGSIDFGVVDQEGREIPLDPRKPFKDAWTEVFEEKPVGEQEFYLLVNGYYEPEGDNAPAVTGEVSQTVTLTIKEYTELVREQDELKYLREAHETQKKELEKANKKLGRLDAEEKESKKKTDEIIDLKDKVGKHGISLIKTGAIAFAAGAVIAFICSFILFGPFRKNVPASDTGTETEQKSGGSDAVSEENEAAEEIVEENGEDGETFQENADQGEAAVISDEPADSEMDVDILTMDPSPLQDLGKNTILIRKEDGNGRNIAFSSFDVYDSGLMMETRVGSGPAFSLAVPEGYNGLSFDIGHIMDTTGIDAVVQIKVDGTKYNLENDRILHNQQPQHIEVRNLKAKQIVEVRVTLSGSYDPAGVYYGIVNLKFQ